MGKLVIREQCNNTIHPQKGRKKFGNDLRYFYNTQSMTEKNKIQPCVVINK